MSRYGLPVLILAAGVFAANARGVPPIVLNEESAATPTECDYIQVFDPEECNSLDDDADGFVDEDFDKDRDGITTCGGDCDDHDNDVYPGAPERPADDNDCDGIVDEGLVLGLNQPQEP